MRAIVTIILAALLLGIGVVLGMGLRRDVPPPDVSAPVMRSEPRPMPPTPRPPLETALAVAPVVGSDDIPAVFAALGLIDGLSYSDTQARLAGGGYLPAPAADRDCASIGAAECAAFPEIEACSGTGEGFCSARYARSDGAVYRVITHGPGGPLVRIFAARGD